MVFDGTGVHLGNSLRLEWLAISASIEHAGGVHGLLKRISLPAEEVVSMRGVALLISGAPDEWLGSIGGPVGLVVELSCIPKSFKGDLGQSNGMRCGARAGGSESTVLCCCKHVILVIGAIEVYSVPASGYC